MQVPDDSFFTQTSFKGAFAAEVRWYEPIPLVSDLTARGHPSPGRLRSKLLAHWALVRLGKGHDGVLDDHYEFVHVALR